MQNRGASFDPKSLNALEPGRRPFHTLNPALASLKDGRVIAYGAMGGDGQPQSQAAIFTRYVNYRQALDRALDARAGCLAAPGVRRIPTSEWNHGSTAIWSIACSRLATTLRSSMTHIPTPWATRARWSCTLTAHRKAGTTRARTAARMASDRKIYAKATATK
jgi:gamma-glutamyltranspeptidase